jgi:hypothetical protein
MNRSMSSFEGVRAVLAVAVVMACIPSFAAPALAQAPAPESVAPCPLAVIKYSNRDVTVTRAAPTMSTGALFSDGGSFRQKPVDQPCDPGKTLGPYTVSAAGKLQATVEGNPPAPATWSLYNSNTGLSLYFEPLVGPPGLERYGPAEMILGLGDQAEKNVSTGEASWPGPGRLTAYTSAPRGAGPLTGSCFQQGYSASAKVVEINPQTAAQPGTDLQPGDHTVTGSFGNAILYVPSSSESVWIGRDTYVVVEPGTADAAVRFGPGEGRVKLPDLAAAWAKAGLPMPQGYRTDPEGFWDTYPPAALDRAYERIKATAQQNPCAAAVSLKLFLEANRGEWTLGTAPARTYDLARDIALTWIVPSEWDALNALAKRALAPIPVLGWAANAQNVYQTSQRVMQEIVGDAATQKAARALRTFDRQAWTREAVQQRRIELGADIDSQTPIIQDARMRMEVQIAELESVVYKMGCMDPRQAGLNPSCDSILQNYSAHRQTLVDAYEAAVKAPLAKILEDEMERSDLLTYCEPAAAGNCDPLKEKPVEPASWLSQACFSKTTKLTLLGGILHVFKETPKEAGATLAIYVVDTFIWPKGTEFTVEKVDETATVRVTDGEVDIRLPNGQELTIGPGQQAALPAGTVSAFDPATDRRGPEGGLSLAGWPVDDTIPEPYGTYPAAFENGAVPAGWLWLKPTQADPKPNATVLETPETGVLRVTVPPNNDLWAADVTSPRLLHKATGDFDLESELLLQCEGKDMAATQFLVYAPGASLGYLKKQMVAESMAAPFYIPDSGWVIAAGGNKLGTVNRSNADSADAPATPVRFKMTRRGDLLKTYWSANGGQTWNLSSRNRGRLPETLWVGWVFKRVANDDLWDVPAVSTLRDVRLRTAPLGSLGSGIWDTVAWPGQVTALGATLKMALDGSRLGYVQAYSAEPLAGDFDLTVRFDATPPALQPDQKVHIIVSATTADNASGGTGDEAGNAFIRTYQNVYEHRYSTWLRIDSWWVRGGWKWKDTEDQAGRLRLVREGGIFSTYYWADGDWALLGDWGEGFSDPVYIDLRADNQWEASVPAPLSVVFTVERLVTPEGELIGPPQEATENPGNPGAAPAGAEAAPLGRAGAALGRAGAALSSPKP